MNHGKSVIEVSSLDVPELQPYRTLRRPLDHIKEGIFVAEGEKVVRRLLESGLTIVSLLVTDQWYERLVVTEGAVPPRHTPRIFVGSKTLMESIVGFNLHQGIMAVARVPDERPLEQIIPKLKFPWLMVALDGLVNAENVGVVVRNSAAFGAAVIIAGSTSGSPYLRRAVRNSMGAVFTLPVVHANDLPAVLRSLRQSCGAEIVGADPHGIPVADVPGMQGNVCIVLGNENDGISGGVLEACTSRVSIPMSNGTDSLNVASASAVFLYEIRRRKGT